MLTINRYDEYGKPQSGNAGRFQYTGQMWLPEIGAYHYKARAYLPHFGIFAQSDPIGYSAGANLYAYVRNDPLNLTDPLGLQDSGNDDDKDGRVKELCEAGDVSSCPEIVINGRGGPAQASASSNVGLNIGYSFGSNEAERQANLDAACDADPSCSGQLIASASPPPPPHDSKRTNRKAIEYIRRIQACRTQECATRAWAEFDAFRKTAEFQLERQKNYDRHEFWVWDITIKGAIALVAGWGKGLLGVLGIFGVETGVEEGGKCAVRGGNC